MMNIEKIYEDDDLLVINKPAGVVVNETKTLPNQETIQSWFWQTLTDEQKKAAVEPTLIPQDFDETYGDPQAIFAERKGMVHRLDKETSGVLVLAKNPSSLVNLLDQFKKRVTQKKYLCLVHGRFGVTEDLISFPIMRSTQDRMKFRVDVEGREAVTAYKVVEYYDALDMNNLKEAGVSDDDLKSIKKNSNSYQGFSLVECWPKTGRTHQIRVHLNHIKHPLVGDKLYVGKKRKKLDEIWCKRHFLHANELTLIHPRTNEKLTLIAPLTEELQRILNFFQK
ncbi:RluA family pseudouridine synthase [Patescibacteria group bacterium]|nr:RluA family pseudouridine synthase [Patescibacteria group bacterium]